MPLVPHRTVAIVVARGGSRRLPGKALLPFAGRPLIAHAVARLAQAGFEVVAGSDSDAILDAARAAGALTVKRDAFHCDESRCTANEMILDMVGRVDAQTVVWAHPTNPLVSPRTYRLALEEFRQAQRQGYDSLVSVTPASRHAWYQGRPLNHKPYAGIHTPASGLLPVLYQDGAIFIRPRQDFLDRPRFVGDRPYLFPMPDREGLDIDTREDYEVALALAATRKNRHP